MQSPPDASPEPGERRRLDRLPSDRYREEPPAGPAPITTSERILRGAAVGVAGVIVLTVLGGPLSVTAGLVAAAGAIGWITGMVLGPMRPLAVAIALASVAVGLVGIWLYAGLEGGALGLIDYLAEVQGILVPIELGLAGILAFATSGS
jgi:hypothetical protein